MNKQAIASAKIRFDQSSEEFFQSGTRYIAALDCLIEREADRLKDLDSSAASNQTRGNDGGLVFEIKTDLKDLRDRRQQTEELLHRLFSDEFADTCSAAE